MGSSISPMQDFLHVVRVDDEPAAATILMPDSVKRTNAQRVRVLAVGPGLYTQTGTRIDPGWQYEVGDEVLLPAENLIEMDVPTGKLLFASCRHIIARIR